MSELLDPLGRPQFMVYRDLPGSDFRFTLCRFDAGSLRRHTIAESDTRWTRAELATLIPAGYAPTGVPDGYAIEVWVHESASDGGGTVRAISPYLGGALDVGDVR